MGADLYLGRSSDDYGREGERTYFRDCYNDSGLFPVLNQNLKTDLSWWQLMNRKMLFEPESDNIMSREGVQIFLCEMKLVQQELVKIPVGQLVPSSNARDHGLQDLKRTVEFLRSAERTEEQIAAYTKDRLELISEMYGEGNPEPFAQQEYDYYMDFMQELIDLLEHAVELGETIYCSC